MSVLPRRNSRRGFFFGSNQTGKIQRVVAAPAFAERRYSREK